MANEDQLIAAYRATRFEAETLTGTLVLRIGERSAPLAELLDRAALDCAAYLTAWNPQSVPQSEERNAIAHRHLVYEIESRAWPYFRGCGLDPSGDWSAEHSVLVLDMPVEDGCDIGRRFGQAAIVVADATATPQLVWLGIADA